MTSKRKIPAPSSRTTMTVYGTINDLTKVIKRAKRLRRSSYTLVPATDLVFIPCIGHNLEVAKPLYGLFYKFVNAPETKVRPLAYVNYADKKYAHLTIDDFYKLELIYECE